MKKFMMMMMLTVIVVSFLIIPGNANAKVGGTVKGKFKIVLQFKGLKWPPCDNPKDNCTLELEGEVSTKAIEVNTEREFFEISVHRGDYDYETDGNVDDTMDQSNLPETMNLGEFILPAELTQGEGDVLVSVVDEPVDKDNGTSRAYVVE